MSGDREGNNQISAPVLAIETQQRVRSSEKRCRLRLSHSNEKISTRGKTLWLDTEKRKKSKHSRHTLSSRLSSPPKTRHDYWRRHQLARRRKGFLSFSLFFLYDSDECVTVRKRQHRQKRKYICTEFDISVSPFNRRECVWHAVSRTTKGQDPTRLSYD